MPPLYPYQAIIHTSPPALLRRYEPTTTPHPLDSFLQGLLLGYLLCALVYLLYIAIVSFIWLTRSTLDLIGAVFTSTWSTCSGSLYTGGCDYGPVAEMPVPGPDVFMTEDGMVKMGWLLCSSRTDVWSMLSQEEVAILRKELAILRKEEAVKNNLDRSQRNKTIGA